MAEPSAVFSASVGKQKWSKTNLSRSRDILSAFNTEESYGHANLTAQFVEGGCGGGKRNPIESGWQSSSGDIRIGRGARKFCFGQ